MTALQKVEAPVLEHQGFIGNNVCGTRVQIQYIKYRPAQQVALHLVPQTKIIELPALATSNPAHPAHWLIETAVNCGEATFEVWQGSPQHIGEISITWDCLSIGTWRFDVRTYPGRGDNRVYPSHYVKRYQAVGLKAGLALLARTFTIEELADAIDAFLDDLRMHGVDNQPEIAAPEPDEPPAAPAIMTIPGLFVPAAECETWRQREEVIAIMTAYAQEQLFPEVNHARKPKSQTYEQRTAARYNRKASRAGDDWLHLAELGVL